MSSKLTPMMQQYMEIKKQVGDSILMFRIGDFYEMLQQDAVVASKVLDITLTKKHIGSGKTVPLAGVPYHSVQPYIRKLTREGYRVAVCEQTTEPQKGKKIVEREVVRTITPGTLIDADALGDSSNNYLAAVFDDNFSGFGLAYADISTGEFRMTVLTGSEAMEDLRSELLKILPSECLIPKGLPADSSLRQLVQSEVDTILAEAVLESFSEEVIAARNIHVDKGSDEKKSERDKGIPALGRLSPGLRAAGAIVNYLQETQKRDLEHLDTLEVYSASSYMVLDGATARNLELLQSIRDAGKRGTLLGVLDKTLTPMGSRLLKQWLVRPLTRKAEIERRHDAVGALVDDSILRSDLREALREVGDIERLIGRACFGNANARDLVALRCSFEKIPSIASRISQCSGEGLRRYFPEDSFDALPELCSLLSAALVDEPPLTVREGGMIRSGFSEELDELHAIQKDGKGWIARFQTSERQRTGIPTLKVGYNKVFGYYIEITKANMDKAPEEYIRKQTLVNAERYITADLKEYESKVLGAQERIAEIEYNLFSELRRHTAEHASRVRATATRLAELDALCSYAEVASANDYCRPEVVEKPLIDIRAGRHPVLEQSGWVERFVPNDLAMDGVDRQVYIITGPNMAGKSTFIRQAALIVLMAQMGSFVPASSATVGLVDRVFTRVGASDNLVAGQSTFMVEMSEAAHILRNATPRSLVILDEIGRGTSTFDGVSLAWAIAEYLHGLKGKGVKTLFATHYHELAELGEQLPRAANYRVLISEQQGKVTFLYKVAPGNTDHSYGIHVAELAGLPRKVIGRAERILRNLEQESLSGLGAKERQARKKKEEAQMQLSLFSLIEEPIAAELRQVDIDNMTPIEALKTLETFVRQARKGEGDS